MLAIRKIIKDMDKVWSVWGEFKQTKQARLQTRLSNVDPEAVLGRR